MLGYIIKRTFYSVFIIAGVLILTFILFRVAAGDPAATVLGKKSSPLELEELRNELGSNKPLFWGKWKKTETFGSADFRERKNLPGIRIDGDCEQGEACLRIRNGKITLKRNFSLENIRIKGEVIFRGGFAFNGRKYFSEKWKKAEIFPDAGQNEIALDIPEKWMEIRELEFFREQKSVFDSQLASSFTEIIRVNSSFPYISFFNFGKTLITREDLKGILWRGMWPSLFLMLPIFFGELAAGIILALFATAFRGGWTDKIILFFSVAGMSVSYLVFIIYGQWYLGYYFDIFPVWGYGELKYLALPVLIGVIAGVGSGIRFYRTVFVNELNREYLRTATAKGCSTYTLYFRHLLRNALIPIITRAASILPFLFTGSLLLETFFGIPGLGFAGVNALMNSDLQMIKALVILSSILFVVINLLADIAYAWADPRIRLEK
ncbi:MAG: hypothetical protein A2017_18065 [Lentisphaerae bacterium GWF2_44_16]|nr:MAG: hypothetical protein A2017_18065 [Lentisphaerae bacterium GWF2_44_16]